MADSDTTQQVTSQTPATKQKNPKRVAAGKLVAERTRIAREEQKKALIKAQSTIAKNQLKQENTPSAADPPEADPPSAADPPVAESTKNVLTTTQWLSVISIVVSLAGIYYKREEIKGLLTKNPPLTPPPVPPNSHATTSPPVSPRRGIRPMD